MKQEVWLSSSAWQIEHLQVLFKFFSPNIIFSHLKQLACQDLPATWKSYFEIFFCLVDVFQKISTYSCVNEILLRILKLYFYSKKVEKACLPGVCNDLLSHLYKLSKLFPRPWIGGISRRKSWFHQILHVSESEEEDVLKELS